MQLARKGSRWPGRELRSRALRLPRKGTSVGSNAVQRTREPASGPGRTGEPARRPAPAQTPGDSRQHQRVLGEAAGPGVLLVVEHGQRPQDGGQALPGHQHCGRGRGSGAGCQPWDRAGQGRAWVGQAWQGCGAVGSSPQGSQLPPVGPCLQGSPHPQPRLGVCDLCSLPLTCPLPLDPSECPQTPCWLFQDILYPCPLLTGQALHPSSGHRLQEALLDVQVLAPSPHALFALSLDCV